jgi:hypothetical protein
MSQFETEVPDPLRQNEPELLAPRGVRTPAGSRLFLVFIGENSHVLPGMQQDAMRKLDAALIQQERNDVKQK